jgi:flagellar biosynthetic protein FliR
MTGAAAVALAAARTVPVAALVPGLGAIRGSRWVRLVVGGVLLATVLPAVQAADAPSVLPLALGRELLVGLTLALVAAVPFYAAQAAGLLVDEVRAPRTPGRRLLGDAYALLALALFAALSGPRLVVVGLAQSYAAFPVGGVVASGGVGLALAAGAQLVTAAVALAAPALAALLLAELLAALAVRVQPALEDAVGGASLRTLLAVAVIALSLGTAMNGMQVRLGSLGERLVQSARGLAGP